ncbi:hypothetical protein PSCLAVI8L_90002 [Pseudoclavibacter sp. 8L]|nr:hypothetical protein PSCLAVI8L_90002 [Pseudoclavibacter sp. 8L]
MVTSRGVVSFRKVGAPCVPVWVRRCWDRASRDGAISTGPGAVPVPVDRAMRAFRKRDGFLLITVHRNPARASAKPITVAETPHEVTPLIGARPGLPAPLMA